MNNKQRSEIEIIIASLRRNEKDKKEYIRMVEKILSKEEDKYDNIPDNLQDSRNAEKMQDAIDNLEDAIDCLEDDDIEGSIEYLLEAKM